MSQKKTVGSTQAKEPRLLTTRRALREAVFAARHSGKLIGLVPTMGALHAGHLSLVEACCRECDYTVVTVFVNPTQFGPSEDYQTYPRALETDLKALSQYAVNLVYIPSTEEMYRPGNTTNVDVGAVAEPLEGRFRAGHFPGVATIVAKLLNLAQPDVAYFGQKDYQQSLVIRRMVDDLEMPVDIRVCPIVRDADGLALSSRNAYLNPQQRQQALVLSQCLKRAKEAVAAGERKVSTVVAKMRELADTVPEVSFQYIELVDPETLREVSRIDGRTLAAVAALVGPTRLIDNCILHPSGPSADKESPLGG